MEAVKSTEQMIQEKNLNAPRLTPEHIDSVIEKELFTRIDGTGLIICTLFLKNGFLVTGESVSVSPENFDEEISKKIAKDNAIKKVWTLEGYLLKQKLFEQGGE